MPPTSGSPGKVMRHSYMELGWSDHTPRNRQDRDQLCPREREEDRSNSSTTAQPHTPVTPILVPDMDVHVRRPPPEVRQGYRPAAPIQRFNNKSLNWPAWFHHFRAVADVHGWNKEQSALQLATTSTKPP